MSVRELLALERGWNGYDAPAPDSGSVETAAAYADSCPEGLPKRVSPSTSGGVAVTHREGSRFVYVEFVNGGWVGTLYSAAGKTPMTRPGTPAPQSVRSWLNGPMS